ncbi:MAG: hypothetical protein CO145_02780 [Candidatus Nealsonbacteria bacterium CG_4_9_14_3_um_filter_37_13]|uniref:Uncharacterized protein n=1 Tax=Candidatus Nealsonbacteria bacterium CG_4_9_14_3_um_filter_37_13 TaxID=1974695 RepID=A0A2M7Z4E2_9BACT|nr:MAG: hypothetical protein CO145_02780 [Candidatus Nealsonbacteria bacterium CG_4_9_14_3_um_filter_37_13]
MKMKPLLTSDLKVKFLGITPVLNDKTGVLNPQQIVSLSSLATFKGRSIKKLLKEIEEKGQNLDERIKLILQRSSLRGHASIATTPSLCLNYEGSKFLDSALTGIYFSSSLVSSGRRTETTEKDIVFPDRIFQNKKAKKIYEGTSARIIKFFNFLLSQGIQKDEASKILQYGIYGTGVIQLPIETIIGLKREYLAEKDWMPEETGFLLKKIEKETKKLGVDLLYSTRAAAPRNVYPYPNIFKDPQKSNLTRELRKSEKLIDGSKIVSLDTSITPELKNKLARLEKKKKEAFSSPIKIKKEWLNFLVSLQEVLRDYNSALRIKVLSSVPWRVWGEKKRHRTCPQIIESIYYCIERASKRFKKFKIKISSGQINKKLLKEVEEVFSIPPSIKRNKELLSEYLLVALKSFQGYQNLVKLKIKPRDAIFLIPRAVKIDILQEYDLYNLLTGYYPLRVCQTAEEEMRRNSLREVAQIKNVLTKKGLGFLNKFIVPKCQIVGFCLEDKSCPMIFNSVKSYNEKFHQEMKEELKKKFQENLKNLRKEA